MSPTTEPAAFLADVLARAHVLIVGVGGIGCPAAWALRAAGVGRLTLIDPDVVELSNLPRQVLFEDADVGMAKAHAASGRLASGACHVRGVHARFDDENADELLADVDLLLDATDGAQTKDWLNQLAVRRGLPLVHAAALRAEARLLLVPAGGRPCLARLFGRLHEELGSCADLGVWNGAVGTIGFLAADAALRLLGREPSVPRGYAVLDFEGGRALSLGAAANPDCPVCAQGGGRSEPFPVLQACASAGGVVPPAEASLDLSHERCPMNLLRARKALAALSQGAVLEILLGEEGAETVPDGVRALGHEVLAGEPRGAGLLLRVRASGNARASQLDDLALRRFARQIVLPEFGEEGQARLAKADVVLLGSGPALESAARYLDAAGVGSLVRVDCSTDDLPPLTLGALLAWAGGCAVPDALRAYDGPVVVLTRNEDDGRVRAQRTWNEARADDAVSMPLAFAFGTLLADAVERVLVLEEAPQRSLALPL